jgi:hypothetical protein
MSLVANPDECPTSDATTDTVVTNPPEKLLSKQEGDMLAREMASAYRRMIEHFRNFCQRSPQEAVARTDALSSPAFAELILTGPPKETSWFELHVLAEKDPALAATRWQEMNRAAVAEVQAKMRAAQALEGLKGSAWQRVQFLALCRELEEGWQPRNGVERQLLDTMALSQSAFLHWLNSLTLCTSLEVKKVNEDKDKWTPPEWPNLKRLTRPPRWWTASTAFSCARCGLCETYAATRRPQWSCRTPAR